jgi:hypothetical protein
MKPLKSLAKAGFVYIVEVVAPDGSVSQREIVPNLIPQEGIDYILGAAIKGAVQISSWYIALFEGNYTPNGALKAADFPGLATECTSYTPTNRVPFTPGAIVAGYLDNSAAKAEFTFTAPKTIYGGVITSSQPWGSTTGVLPSAVRFASPKVIDVLSILRVTAALTLASA